MEKNISMGEVIRRLRTERGWTQEKLAEQLHVTPQSVSKWETEQSMPDVSQVPLLARVFGVSSDTLFGMESMEEESMLTTSLYPYETDPENALALWREVYEKLSGGVRENIYGERDVYELVYLGYRLCCPESILYHAGCAEEVLRETLSFALKHEKMMEGSRVLVRGAFQNALCLLYAMAGDTEKAMKLACENGLDPQSLAVPMESRVFFLAGNREAEEGALRSCVGQALNYMLDSIVGLALNYLDRDKPERALECAVGAMEIIELMCRRRTELPPLHDRDRGNLMQLAAVACVKLKRREEALAWLERMVESLTELHEGRKRTVMTALLDMDGLNIVRMNKEYMRFRSKMLLRALDDPRLEELRDDDHWRQLREKAEMIGI